MDYTFFEELAGTVWGQETATATERIGISIKVYQR